MLLIKKILIIYISTGNNNVKNNDTVMKQNIFSNTFQNTVPQKFQPFVRNRWEIRMLVDERLMSQRENKNALVAKFDAKSVFYRL